MHSDLGRDATIRRVVLGAIPDVLAIYLFGSAARGDARPNSDLDIALLTAPGGIISDTLGLMADLAGALGREVDLVDLRRASDVLRMQVLREGSTLYAANPHEVLGWEAEAMTRYGHYRREVRDILADFEQTGIGYRR
ncbi:MAG: nucleotidyltransferase domain-containing protein [Pseudomonadales bacterium]|nr:nucleotidyltransferase domain-containing protein [Pseudomonadales bacterium]